MSMVVVFSKSFPGTANRPVLLLNAGGLYQWIEVYGTDIIKKLCT